MLEELLISEISLRRIIRFRVPGIHSETLGSANVPWDLRVVDVVSDACIGVAPGDKDAWYVVHLRWFARPGGRKDLDNLRLKPILDQLTGRIWPDDNIRYIRAIYNEVMFVDQHQEERVEVSVWSPEDVPIAVEFGWRPDGLTTQP